MEKVRAHIIVSGRVQGVGYRNNTFQQAQKIGLSGWVKNLEDGRVEAVFEGEKQEVEKIINWAKKGPLLANISDFKIDWQEHKGEFSNFEIK
ncbi:MAG: acylphosphatase [Patescibacteria group bacterium]|nr:acylphosphatase [Patescibacteria group bacterium]